MNPFPACCNSQQRLWTVRLLTIIQDHMRWAQLLGDFLKERLNLRRVFEVRGDDQMGNFLQLLRGMAGNRNDLVPSIREFPGGGKTGIGSCAKLPQGLSVKAACNTRRRGPDLGSMHCDLALGSPESRCLPAQDNYRKCRNLFRKLRTMTMTFGVDMVLGRVNCGEDKGSNAWMFFWSFDCGYTFSENALQLLIYNILNARHCTLPPAQSGNDIIS